MQEKGGSQIIVAIIVGALIIGGAIIYSKNDSTNNVPNPQGQNLQEEVREFDGPMPVTDQDHMRGGSVDSRVKVIEFSDIECPFCKRFHQTTKELSSEYDNQVAFVFRHFPLIQLHQNAVIEAHATECANEIGGKEKFWEYLDLIYSTTTSNDGLDLNLLPEFADRLGLDRVSFESCMASGRYNEKINSHIEDAINSGARGTPYTVILGPNGEKVIVSGAQPKQDVKQIIDSLLAL
jgi:protein-disulfide isomerase